MVCIPALLRDLSVNALLVSALTIATALPAANARAATDTDAAQAIPASAKLETDSYLVEIAPNGSYKAGLAGSVKVTLTAKGIFHINGQYPYRFKAAASSEGVTYPKPVLERADGQFDEKKAVFNLPFVSSHTGKVDVGGVFHLSVCSPGSCIMQKAPLEISVTVE
jgi:hypothetical protein